MAKATREDFEKFLKDIQNTINTPNWTGMKFFDFKDYSEFVEELNTYLLNNSNRKWKINTKFGIGIEEI